jgi:hypothetical protein
VSYSSINIVAATVAQCARPHPVAPANRLVADLDGVLSADDIMSLEASEVPASRMFGTAEGGGDAGRRSALDSFEIVEFSGKAAGAATQGRTVDLSITNGVLYH